MVSTADDCALHGKSTVGRRGIAGAALAIKVAGAAAAEGLTLAQVTAAALAAVESIGSMGCSASMCHIPGRPAPEERCD
jgi:triose/dihydroxyacetone kinase / FAD-AMP lyase (cyclizing)